MTGPPVFGHVSATVGGSSYGSGSSLGGSGGGATPQSAATSQLSLYNVTNFLVPTTGAGASAPLAALAALIGGAKATMYFPPGNYGLEADLVIPSNILVWMARGAYFTATAPGRTLTINGNITAAFDTIFNFAPNAFAVVFGTSSESILFPQWWGALGLGPATDDSAAFNAMFISAATSITGKRCLVPPPAVSYGVKDIRLRQYGTEFIGIGGRVPLTYSGTAAEALAVVRVDKTLDNGGNNFREMKIDGFVIDGNSLALYALKLDGFTRRSIVQNCSLQNAVCNVWATNSYYATFKNVECQENPAQMPVGMNPATYAAAKYGAYFDVAHSMSFENFILYRLGGGAGNDYIAAARFGNSYGIEIDSLNIEACDVAVNGKRLARALIFDPSSSVHAGSVYVEQVDTTNELVRVNDNAQFGANNFYINGLKSTVLLAAQDTAPLSLANIDGENVELTDRIFKLLGGTEFSNLSLDAISLGCGAQGGAIFDAGTTTGSKLGLICDPILRDNRGATGPTGYLKNGYGLSISGNFIEVTKGTAMINGQSVGFSKNTGLRQRLVPDLTVADTWNIKLSAAGTPYIERQTALRGGSAFSPTIGTFTTAGGGAAPAALTSVPFNRNRINGGIVDLPLTPTVTTKKDLTGSLALASGVQASLATITLSPTVGEDDFMSLELEYVISTAGGGERSCEVGRQSMAFSKDNGNNYVVSAVAASGVARSTDAGMIGWVLAFTWTNVANVATLKVTSTPNPAAGANIEFTVRVKGGIRAASAAALAAGVTQAQ